MKKRIIIGLAGTTLLLVMALFVGVFHEREWPDDIYVFIKHRPSFKMVFQSPKGEASGSALSSVETEQERLYVEFVEKRGGSRRSLYLPFKM